MNIKVRHPENIGLFSGTRFEETGNNVTCADIEVLQEWKKE